MSAPEKKAARARLADALARRSSSSGPEGSPASADEPASHLDAEGHLDAKAARGRTDRGRAARAVASWTAASAVRAARRLAREATEERAEAAAEAEGSGEAPPVARGSRAGTARAVARRWSRRDRAKPPVGDRKGARAVVISRRERLRPLRRTAARRAVIGRGLRSGAPSSPRPRRTVRVAAGHVASAARRLGRIAGGIAGGWTLFAVAMLGVPLIALAAAFSVFGGSSQNSLDGLPPYITDEMVQAAIRAQSSYGHPSGATLAQIIVESGSGRSLSKLASKDKNLFGIKYVDAMAHEPEVAGSEEWGTEESEAGSGHRVTASFAVFTSFEACVTFRSRWFLAQPRYRGNRLISQAISEHDSDKMADGLAEAGWATSPAYARSLKATMDKWGLRRFDTMTIEQWRQRSGGEDYEASSEQQRAIADAARSTPSPGPGLCAAWVERVYAAAGLPKPAGNACDLYWRYCRSADRSKLKVGMIIAVPSYARYDWAGRTYGHVGIYIGGGTVMENVGAIKETPLDRWIAYYGDTYTPKWGFAAAVDR